MRHTWNVSISNDKVFYFSRNNHSTQGMSYFLIASSSSFLPSSAPPSTYSIQFHFVAVIATVLSFLHSISFRLVPLCRVNVSNISFFFC